MFVLNLRIITTALINFYFLKFIVYNITTRYAMRIFYPHKANSTTIIVLWKACKQFVGLLPDIVRLYFCPVKALETFAVPSILI